MEKRKQSAMSSGRLIRRAVHSVWFFPLILLVPLVILTLFKISGTSIGAYSQLYYGQGKDTHLVTGQPRYVRSDEWLVNTQLTIAQKANDFQRINHNIGNGEDMSVLTDVPYKEWSTAFKPQNWAFFVMPFENAFAFKWWFMAYLLMVSCYLFTLRLLPDKKGVAILLSIGLVASPFVQWWYQYATLGPIYYAFFICTAAVALFEAKSLKTKLVTGAVLAYLLTAFALVLYPPFQIACAIVAAGFTLGYITEVIRERGFRHELRSLVVGGAALILAACFVGLFVVTRSDVLHTISNTAYPGKRIVKSGGYDVKHFLSGNLDTQLQSDIRSAHYVLPGQPVNQSELASFTGFSLFLLLPVAVFSYAKFRKKDLDIPLVSTGLVFVLFLAWLFVPHLGLFGKVFLLDKVPQNRLIVGFLFASIIYLILWIRADQKGRLPMPKSKRLLVSVGLACLAFIVFAAIHIAIHRQSSGYIGGPKALLLALPVPVALFFFLQRKYLIATGILALFALQSGHNINPLYQGLTLEKTFPLVRAVHDANNAKPGVWASDTVFLENIPAMDGAKSVTGVYAYPQLKLWDDLRAQEESSEYNRYAHVTFGFDTDPTKTIKPALNNPGPDQFKVTLEVCDKFLDGKNVRYILTATKLDGGENQCSRFVKKVDLPYTSYYIYERTSF